MRVRWRSTLTTLMSRCDAGRPLRERLAHLLAEDRAPPAEVWRQPRITSRLLEYEVWNRINALGLARSHGQEARALVARLAFLELEPRIHSRALEPFPTVVRTLDALHLASIEFLRTGHQVVELLRYDERLLTAARALRISIICGLTIQQSFQRSRMGA